MLDGSLLANGQIRDAEAGLGLVGRPEGLVLVIGVHGLLDYLGI